MNLKVLLALSVIASLEQPLVAVASGQGAPGPGDEILAPPPTYKGNDVTVDEKLGARLPLDTRFRRSDGNIVTLGEVLRPTVTASAAASGANALPTIVTFNYSDCPMLCNLQLNGLTAALPALGVRKDGAVFVLGEQFRVVTISLDPDEDLGRLTKMRDKYLKTLPEAQREDARAGWTFLAAEHPGDDVAIRRVASTVGFQYTFIKERAEWAHPASLVFVSPLGQVTRYVHGIEFDDAVMRESLLKAGTAEAATSVGFMNRCYHYDPSANDHSRTGVLALRIGAAGFLVLLLSGLGMLHLVRGSRSRRSPHDAKGNRS